MALSFHPTTAPLFGHRLPAPDDAADMMSFLLHDDDDVHSEVTDALLGFVYDPLDASNTALDDLLSLPPSDADSAFLAPLDDVAAGAERHCGKRQRSYAGDAWYAGQHQQRNGALDDDLLRLPASDAFLAPLDGGAIGEAERRRGKRQQQQQGNADGNQQVPALTGTTLVNDFVLPLPPPPPVPTLVPEPLVFVRGADANKAAAAAGGGACQAVQNSAARQRRKRISEKTAELARLIPGAHKLNTAEMLEEAARHVKLLQAQVGMLALMRAAGSSEMQEEKRPSAAMAQERMHALLARGSVQERLAAEGRCLVPTRLVDAVAKEEAVKANPVLRRDLGRFVASLQGQ